MKTISRYIMTLALLLTAVTGAWAQGTLNVVELEVPAGWANDFSNVTAGDLTGFSASTMDKAQAWTGAPTEGNAVLFYAFDGDNVSYVYFVEGEFLYEDKGAFSKITVFGESNSNVKFYYTAEPTDPNDIEVTPGSSTNTWTFTMPGSDVVLTPIYAPTKVTLAANDNAMGTVEVASGSKVEWTADTWKGWTQNTKVYTVDDITMTSSESARIQEYISEDEYNHSLGFFVRKMVDDATVTFSTTGDPFSRIEFTMIDDYSDDWNPSIMPNDNWTFEGKSAVWEGEATKSLTLQSCTTFVSKITFFKGAAIPDGVTVNGDGTFTVAKTATVTLTATPAEGYKLKGWSDAPDCTDLVREITIEPGEEDMIITAIFEEMTYTATFTAANANTIEAGKATVTVGGTAATVTEGKLQGVKMGTEVKMTAKEGYKFRKVEVKKGAEAPAILLDNTMTAWTAGKYAVPAGGLTYSAAITVSGDVTLVLTDGETLTLNKGISLASGATLTVQGNGTMNVNGTNESTASTVAGSGTLVLTSGTLNAKGGNGQSLTITWDMSEDWNTGASGGVAINGNVTVSGGTVTATGGNGGNLNTSAIGFSEGNHGGNGGAAISGNVTVNAGGWTATNGSNGTYTAGDDTNCSAGTGGKAVAGTVTDNR